MSLVPQSVSRSPDFWFDDGNLVLQVGTKQFRIHRGLICASSMVFRDMHALSQPEEKDTVDVYPVVLLQGDTEGDWVNLLEYIYFPAKASQEGDHLSFPRVASMLRLGSKYEFAEIRSLALRTIHTQVPVHALDAWDNFFNANRRYTLTPYGQFRLKPVGCIPGDWLKKNIIDLLNLAIEQGLQTILPKAILYGTKRSDGTVATISPIAVPTLLLGREALHAHYFTMTMSWLTEGKVPTSLCSGAFREELTGDPGVDSMTSCQQSRVHGLAAMAAEYPNHTDALDVPDDEWYSGFCGSCIEEITNLSQRQRRQIWEDLPRYFDLPDLSDLKDRE